MDFKRIGFIAALALLGSVAEASAAIVNITYTGTVATNDTGLMSYDSGLFGAPGTLAGNNFIINFSFDTTTPGAFTSSGPTRNFADGGSAFGAASPWH